MTEAQRLCPSCGCVVRPIERSQEERVPPWFYPFLMALLLLPVLIEWASDRLLKGVAVSMGFGLAAFVMLRAWHEGRKRPPLLACVGCHRVFTDAVDTPDIQGTYGRVKIHWAERALTIVLSVAVISYVAVGLWIEELPVPGFKPQYDTKFFYGTAAWLMAAAVLCMVSCWLSFFA